MTSGRTFGQTRCRVHQSRTLTLQIGTHWCILALVGECTKLRDIFFIVINNVNINENNLSFVMVQNVYLLTVLCVNILIGLICRLLVG